MEDLLHIEREAKYYNMDDYGTFECPICHKVFHRKKEFHGHMGSHRKGISESKDKLKCKFCGDKLIEGKNWPSWAVRQGNIICKKCKRIQNKESYKKNKDTWKENKKERMKKRLEKRREGRKTKLKLKRKITNNEY